MKKWLAVLFAALAVASPWNDAGARGGRGGRSGGRAGRAGQGVGGGTTRRKTDKKNLQERRDRAELENREALLRDAAADAE